MNPQVIILAACVLGMLAILWKLKQPIYVAPPPARGLEMIEKVRSSVAELAGQRDEWRDRALWLELYASQLESELGIPEADRITSESHKHSKK